MTYELLALDSDGDLVTLYDSLDYKKAKSLINSLNNPENGNYFVCVVDHKGMELETMSLDIWKSFQEMIEEYVV